MKNAEKIKLKGLVPMLETENLVGTIEFYEKYLDFKCCGKYPDKNPCWASLMNGDAEIMFSTPNDHLEFSKPTLTGSIYVYVENVNELWEKIKDEVEVIYEPENFDYGMREFGIKDCKGYILNIGQNIEIKL